ncbi:caspase-10 isoform X2 [Hippopotamus amphibius kiboko]|uniref:caspase-10 isoform X2 n=1 Tax=Hippopotamus amphibius kiboko TaxID=575201 RepID=UPI0025950805|nr:caspase-10 isoform X2 [Hippopotamus amphibius kiboko]
MTSLGQSLNSTLDENCQVDFRKTLLIIDSYLGEQDVERLKFLCRDCIAPKNLEKCSSALDIFDYLLAEEWLSKEDPFFLAELLYIIKQKALLRHLRCTKEQVECWLPARRRVSLFRNLLYELSEDISSENLKSMIFLLRESIPKVQMEISWQEEHAQSNGDRATLVSMEMVGASIDPVTSETSTKETAVYRMNRKHRGHCVVVNNRSFTSLSKRQGTDKDAECLKRVFQWLGFHVHIYVNVTKGHLDEVLQEFKTHPGHADGDCFVFCVLTHGKFGAVYSSDGDLIPIREIMSHFTAEQCPGLAHKPKLFFIQACQGEEIQPSVSIEADAVNPEHVPPSLQDSIPVEADFLLGLATVPGYVSFRHVEEGSWYIQSLYNHLKDLVPRQEDILSILTAVNNDVSRQADKHGRKKQMPQPAFTLRKKVVFPVPQEELLL